MGGGLFCASFTSESDSLGSAWVSEGGEAEEGEAEGPDAKAESFAAP